MKEVVRTEILKLREVGIIYPIADSRWVSPVHCVLKKGGITVVPNDSNGNEVISVQLGSVYTGTSVRDIQTVKAFGDFTNQTEWSQYAKAINSQLHELVVEPLKIDESIQGKTVTVIGAATASGEEVTVTPVSITIE